MTASRLAAPNSRWRWALCALCAAAASCKHDPDRVAGLVAAFEQLDEARCECASSAAECAGDGILDTECERRVVREHQDAIEGWLVCLTREARAATECVRSAECAELGRGACEFDLDDVCGEPPAEPSRAIERDLERLCLEPIGCEDGSTAQGRFCNGSVECLDGSDESFCEDSGSSGSSSGGSVDPGVAPPPVTPTVPPPPDASGATADTCVQRTPPRPSINPSCVTCLCSVSPSETLACDDVCWALLECALDACPDAPAGSMDQTQCVIESCSDSLGGAAAATAVGAALRDTCSAVCPPF